MTDAKKPKLGNPNWHKGMSSPNPAGRPRLSAEAREWVDLHGGHMDVTALNALRRAMIQAKNLTVSVKAAEVWLNRRLPEQLEVFTDSAPLAGIDWSKVSTEKLKALRELAVAIATEQRASDAAAPAERPPQPRGD